MRSTIHTSLEVRDVFLDISKTANKIWQESLILKEDQCRIQENLHLIKCFLKNRKQRVVLNGQTSFCTNVLAVISQGSILSPLFFLIYIIDLLNDLSSTSELFADNTFLVEHKENILANELDNDLRKISNWTYQWKISFNPDPLKQAHRLSSLKLYLIK